MAKAAPFGSEEGETPVTTARDEVQVTPTVAAFEAVLHRWIWSAAVLCSGGWITEREIHGGSTTRQEDANSKPRTLPSRAQSATAKPANDGDPASSSGAAGWCCVARQQRSPQQDRKGGAPGHAPPASIQLVYRAQKPVLAR